MDAPYELSACIEWLFAEDGRPFAERARAAADAGLAAVEFWDWRDRDLAGLRRVRAETGIVVSSFVSEPRGRLVDPRTHPEFLQGVVASCTVARDLGAPCLVVLAGDELPGVERERQRAAVVDALRVAAPIAAGEGVTLVLEPLNTLLDHPGHFLDRTVDGLGIVREVGHPGLRLLYDLYHSVVMGERPGDVLANGGGLVGHVQIADAPGRHEPGTGDVDWAEALAALRAGGYRGRIGLEYRPTADTVASLGRIREAVAADAGAAG